MVHIKSFTDVTQSKTLSTILPPETADTYWWSTSLRHYIEAMDDGDFNEKEGHVRAWSLAALLNYLRDINFFPNIEADEDSVTMSIDYYDEDKPKLLVPTRNITLVPMRNVTIKAETFVDACYELILRLYELNLLGL